MRPPPDALNGNPTRARADWPAVVIAGGYQTGVLAMRGLQRRGVRVTCIESEANPDFPAFRSRYGPAVSCPDPDAEPERWLRFMLYLSYRVGGTPVLIPSADQFVSAIARDADTLSRAYVVSPGIRVQGLLATKETQYALAERHGMPIPRTAFVSSTADLTQFAREASFPCLLKPLSARSWAALPSRHPLSGQKVAIAETRADLLRAWQLSSEVCPGAVAQEIIQGPDTGKRVYVGVYDARSRRVAHAMFRELRCDPLGFGPATVSEPVSDPETDAVCDAFLRDISYAGVCEVEMKWDTRDGRVKMIEANPRLTGGGDAAPYAGVDTCWLHYLDLIGQPVQPVAPSGNDFRHIVLRSDARAIVNYVRAGLLSWMDLLRSYRPPLAFYDFDLHDLGYSAQTLWRMARSAGAAFLRRKHDGARTLGGSARHQLGHATGTSSP